MVHCGGGVVQNYRGYGMCTVHPLGLVRYWYVIYLVIFSLKIFFFGIRLIIHPLFYNQIPRLVFYLLRIFLSLPFQNGSRVVGIYSVTFKILIVMQFLINSTRVEQLILSVRPYSIFLPFKSDGSFWGLFRCFGQTPWWILINFDFFRNHYTIVS